MPPEIVLLSPHADAIKGRISSHMRELAAASSRRMPRSVGRAANGKTNLHFTIFPPKELAFYAHELRELVRNRAGMRRAHSEHRSMLQPSVLGKVLRPDARIDSQSFVGLRSRGSMAHILLGSDDERTGHTWEAEISREGLSIRSERTDRGSPGAVSGTEYESSTDHSIRAACSATGLEASDLFVAERLQAHEDQRLEFHLGPERPVKEIPVEAY
jgi:hypothetical protein